MNLSGSREVMGMLQLVYGNDGVNYKALAKSGELSDSQYTELKRDFLGYQPVRNPERYGDAGQEPVAYSMAVTDLSGKLPEEKLLLSKKARMCHIETPSYYSHLYLADMDESIFQKDFPSLFDYGFIGEEEIEEYKEASIDKFARRHGYFIDSGRLREDQIKAALYLLYYNMGSWAGKVTIIIDEDGAEYNRRALEIIAGIYGYIPWSLRRRAGFTTYSTPDIKEAAQIRLRIMPRCYMGECGKGDTLDFCEENLLDAAAVAKIPENIRKFVDMLWEAEEGAEGCFREWWDIFGSTGTLEEHLDYCNKTEIWKTGDLGKYLDEIIDYALEEKNKKSPLYGVFKESFGGRTGEKGTKKEYNDLLRRKIMAVSDFNNFLKLLNRHLAFRNEFPQLKLYKSNLIKWFETNMLKEAVSQEDERLCIAELSRLEREVDGLEWKKEDWAGVKRNWGKLIKNERNILQRKMECKQKAEQEEIGVFFQGLYGDPDAGRIGKRYRDIKYEENQEIFREMLYGFLKDGIRQQEEDFREYDYIRGREMIEECEEALGEAYYSELEQRQKALADKCCEMEDRLTIRLDSREDLEKYYTNREYLRMMCPWEEEKVYGLMIGDGEPVWLLEKQMDGIAVFLLNGTRENWERAEAVFRDNRELLAGLLEEGLVFSKDKNVWKRMKQIQRSEKKRVWKRSRE